jgi:hypothetical protein
MKTYLSAILFASVPLIASAELQPSDATSAQVVTATEAFSSHLQADNFDAEYAMLTQSLKQQVSLDQWRNQRTSVVGIAGPTVQFTPHQLTYYNQGALIAAVDYAIQAGNPDVYICGYLLWQITDEDTIGLSRFEQNIVEAPLMRSMDVGQAAQLMTQWRCPASLIEGMLEIRLQN